MELVDITDVALGWFKFLDDEVVLDGYDYGLVISIYNREYSDVDLFFTDLRIAVKNLI